MLKCFLYSSTHSGDGVSAHILFPGSCSQGIKGINSNYLGTLFVFHSAVTVSGFPELIYMI